MLPHDVFQVGDRGVVIVYPVFYQSPSIDHVKWQFAHFVFVIVVTPQIVIGIQMTQRFQKQDNQAIRFKRRMVAFERLVRA